MRNQRGVKIGADDSVWVHRCRCGRRLGCEAVQKMALLRVQYRVLLKGYFKRGSGRVPLSRTELFRPLPRVANRYLWSDWSRKFLPLIYPDTLTVRTLSQRNISFGQSLVSLVALRSTTSTARLQLPEVSPASCRYWRMRISLRASNLKSKYCRNTPTVCGKIPSMVTPLAGPLAPHSSARTSSHCRNVDAVSGTAHGPCWQHTHRLGDSIRISGGHRVRGSVAALVATRTADQSRLRSGLVTQAVAAGLRSLNFPVDSNRRVDHILYQIASREESSHPILARMRMLITHFWHAHCGSYEHVATNIVGRQTISHTRSTPQGRGLRAAAV